MNRARMLGKAGHRRMLVARGPRARRCACVECAIVPEHGQQRAREKRTWRRDAAREVSTGAR